MKHEDGFELEKKKGISEDLKYSQKMKASEALGSLIEQIEIDAINGIIKVEPRTSKKLSANWVFKKGEEYE